VSGGVPAVLELVGVCCNDGKRPDGKSLFPWSRHLLDFTCSDTVALSNNSTSTSGTSRLANSAVSYDLEVFFSVSIIYFSPVYDRILGA